MTIANNPANPGAVIVDGHGRADLGVVRALGEKGVPIYLLTDDRWSPVALSRYITRRFVFPPPHTTEEERIGGLVEIGKRFKHKPVFFSTGDSSLTLFSRHRTRLEPYFHHHLADAELIEKLYDKAGFAVLAGEKELKVPHSVVPRTADHLAGEMGSLTFPVMVKPFEKRRWAQHPEIYELTGGNLKGVRIDTPEALMTFYKKVAAFDSGMVVQDYIEGRDEAIYSLHAYMSGEGEMLGAFTGQKLRTWPIHRGIGCFQDSVYEPRVIEVGEEILRKLGYVGHAIVQMKRVPDSDDFLVFEINCRYSTWNYLHSAAGVNLPYAAYRDSLGEKQEALPRQREGIRWIDLPNDLKAFAAYRRIGEWSLGGWLRSYLGRNCYAVFAWNDPRPVLVPLAAVSRRAMTAPARWARRAAGMEGATSG